jgi:hypothetical protein
VIAISPNTRYERLLAGGVSFAGKQQEYVLTINILAQVVELLFLSVPTNSIKDCTSN